MFENKYGYFSETGKEYVITDPHTPNPWCNRISNGIYGVQIAQNGNGFSWVKNPDHRLVTASSSGRTDQVGGKYFYLRDRKTGHFWSLTDQPTQTSFERCEIRHGIGYTIFVRQTEAILSELKMFVVCDKPLEILDVKITNRSNSAKELDLISYLEWACPNAESKTSTIEKTFSDTRFDARVNAIKHHQNIWKTGSSANLSALKNRSFLLFNSVCEAPVSYEADQSAFLGTYGCLRDPLALKNKTLSRNEGRFVQPVSSLQNMLSLNPSESKTLVYTLGSVFVSESGHGDEEADQLIRKYGTLEGAKNAFSAVNTRWNELLSGDEVRTPDHGFDQLIDHFTKYQAISANLWTPEAVHDAASSANETHSLQDAMIFLETAPDLTRSEILKWAKDPSQENPLWFPYVLEMYLEETLDFSLLLEKCSENTTIYQLGKRAIQNALLLFQAKQMAPIDFPDQPDERLLTSGVPAGESVFQACLMISVLSRFQRSSRRMQDSDFIREMQNNLLRMKKWVNEVGWDGEWLLSGISPSGKKAGSKTQPEGQMYLLPNVWGILSDCLSPDRQKSIVNFIDHKLRSETGLRLLSPTTASPNSDLGLFTLYPPGYLENGGFSTLFSVWAISACVKGGNVDLAWQIFQGISPLSRSAEPDQYLNEPYVLSDFVDAPETRQGLRGRNPWRTASAQWLHRIAVTDLIGVKATYEGLLIDPHVPSEWKQFSYRRNFRHAVYECSFTRGKTFQLIADGKTISGKLLPDYQDGKTHLIQISFA